MTLSRVVRFIALVLLASLGQTAGAVAQERTGLTGGPQVARVYDAILDAQFGEVPQLRARTCPPAPPAVCALLDVVSLWWQIQLDPLNLSRDQRFQSSVDASIAAMERWTADEPRRAEAWFYLGGAYGARGQWRVLRGQILAAARDGKRIKASLEQALLLDPNLTDAYFGIGLYHYYADVAPVAAKVLRFFLLLPGGDRRAGLQEMLRARESGQLLRSEADYQLHLIYLWYEHQPMRAIGLVAGLRDRYPHNPFFPQVIAEIQDTYLHDPTASLRSWEALLAGARAGAFAEAGLAETRARLGMATQLDALYESDRAAEQLRAVIQAKPLAPFGATAQAQQRLDQTLKRLGDPAYRLALEGWRALERGALDDSERLLAQSLQLRPDDPVTRFRQARLLQARKRDAAALAILEALVRARGTTPPVFYASACVDAARLHEQRGAPTRAIELYRTARGIFGADQRTIDEAQRAIARLSTASPR